MSLDNFDELTLKKEKPKKERKEAPSKISATKLSGIKNGGFVIFRGNKKYKIRLVPADLWNGGAKQEFDEKEFSNFDKPAFYKGD